MKRRSGVYLYRTNKPGALLVLPLYSLAGAAMLIGAALHTFGLPWWGGLIAFTFSGRHNAYVGETGSFAHRHRQHTIGGGAYRTVAKPWSDLNPKCYRLPTWGWKPWLRFVETLGILLLWPVYNDRKNRWNPRRISLGMAQAQRGTRDAGHVALRLVLSVGFRHVPALMVLGVLFLWVY